MNIVAGEKYKKITRQKKNVSHIWEELFGLLGI